MKLSTAIGTAEQQTNPKFLGHKWPNSGLYLANNGQYMIGPTDRASTSAAPHSASGRGEPWARTPTSLSNIC